MTTSRDQRTMAGLLAGALAMAAAGCAGAAPDPAPTPPAGGVSVAVEPALSHLRPLAFQDFVATVSGTSTTRVSWTVVEPGGGAIDAGGRYTAPSTPGTYHVRATAVADTSRAATATVVIATDPGVVVSISPPTASVTAGASVRFGATVTGASDTRVSWSVREGGAGGTIDAAGGYTAPAAAGTFHVVATSVADTTRSATATVTVTATVPPPADLAAQLDVLSRKAIFFDHASVGENLIDGVATLLRAATGAKPTLVNMNVSNGGLRPDLIHAGVWAESMKLALLNGNPLQKVSQFRDDLATGVGARVDVAFMKFCFVDFTNATDVNALFTAYQSMIASVKALYPNVRFVHLTAPLETPSNGAYNAVREAFSDRIRSTYGADVFDLALLESTRPDGTRELSGGVPALVPAYSGDSGHLNSTGQARISPELVKFLANLR